MPARGYAVPVTTRRPITRDTAIMGGTPVFTTSRVRVAALFDYLNAGDAIDVFLADLPSVERAHVIAVLRLTSAPA